MNPSQVLKGTLDQISLRLEQMFKGDRTILGRTDLLSAHERFLGSFGIFCFSFLPESPIVDRSGRLSRLVWSNSQIDRHFASVIAVFSYERTLPLFVHRTYTEVRMDCEVSTIFNRNRRTWCCS